MLSMTPTPNPTCKFMTLNLTCQFAPPATAASLKLKSATPQATPVGDWKSTWTYSRPTASRRQPRSYWWKPTATALTICWLRSMRPCLLYTSDAADEEDSVDLGGRRIIKKKKN